MFLSWYNYHMTPLQRDLAHVGILVVFVSIFIASVLGILFGSMKLRFWLQDYIMADYRWKPTQQEVVRIEDLCKDHGGVTMVDLDKTGYGEGEHYIIHCKYGRVYVKREY